VYGPRPHRGPVRLALGGGRRLSAYDHRAEHRASPRRDESIQQRLCGGPCVCAAGPHYRGDPTAAKGVRKMGRNAHMARRKMSHVIDELYTALFQLGGAAVDFQLRRETEGLRLSVRGEFSPENRREVERMAQTLQPAV